jgi:hypothetical protein
MLWVKGDAGLLSDVDHNVIAWLDQAGQHQNLLAPPPDPSAILDNVDSIDGIPCASFPLIGNPKTYLYSPSTMKDSHGVNTTAATIRTLMAVFIPRSSNDAGPTICGGALFAWRSTPCFEALFDLESTFLANGFYLFANAWRFSGDELRAGATAMATYDGRPTMAEWRGASTPGSPIAVNINNEVGGVTITPSASVGVIGVAPPAGFVLGNCDNLATLSQVNFHGSIAEVLAWDYDLSTVPAARTQALQYLANRYPSCGIMVT